MGTTLDNSEIKGITCGAMVAGGSAIVRRAGEKTLFVDGGLPGEVVDVRVTEEKAQHIFATVTHVQQPSAQRTTPICEAFARGCGGCQWQHVAPSAQLATKVDIVNDALSRIAKRDDIHAVASAAVPPTEYRTTLHMVSDANGQLGFHRRTSHEVITVDDCPVAHGALRALLSEVRGPANARVSLRVGVASGEITLWTHGAPVDRVRAPSNVQVSQTGRKVHVHETVRDATFRVSPRSFFQSGPAAASLLATATQDAIPSHVGIMLDAYAGIGVFAKSVGKEKADAVVLIESDGTAVNDAKVNVEEMNTRIILGEVAQVRLGDIPQPDVIVADPARSGLGPSASRALSSLGAEQLMLWSCDPASCARDVALLTSHGYAVKSVQVFDVFPQTHHVETLTVLQLQ